MKLYVGNLPFSTTRDDLMKLFGSYGEIEDATIIADKFNGRSKGFGFVTFKDDASGKKAIAEMNEKDIGGRNIKVSEAKPMEERPERPRRFQSRDRERRR